MTTKQEFNLRRGFDHIGAGTGSFVHDGKGNFLLQKRGPEARDERGHWDICGGAIEFGDTIEETLRRELKEELCTEPLDMEFLIVYDVHRQLDGRQSHWVTIVYMVKVDPSTVRIGEPHKISELGWFTSNSLPSPLHSQFHKALEAALEQGIIK